jgi:signal transduction histidine kinase
MNAAKLCRKEAATHNSSLVRFAEHRDSGGRAPRRIALIDSQGNIVAVNKDWMLLAEKTGAALDRVGPGANYLEVCREAYGSSSASQALNGIHAVLKNKTSSFAMDYACHTASGRAYFRMGAALIEYRNVRVAISHTDITDLQVAKDSDYKRLRQFARRLINAQEEERQRISREIHDDLGSRIALTACGIQQIMKRHPKSTQELNKILEAINDLSTVLHDLSHCLHPPQLQYVGIGPALKSLHEKFEKTCGIRTDVVVPAELPRLPDEVELCIFRISQECLQNAAKYSSADQVRTVLEHTPLQIRLIVSDTGRGFILSEAIQKSGLGLLSMEERALSIGGCLTVNSSPGFGTEVRLTIPTRSA